jgi:PAS domain S-box-containing protein
VSEPRPSPESEHLTEELDRVLDDLAAVAEEQKAQQWLLSRIRRSGQAYHERYCDLFEFAPDGYLVTDLKNIIREANQACGQLFHCDVQTLLGGSLTAWVAVSDHPMLFEVLCRTRLSAELNQITDWEIHLKPFRGPVVPVSVKVAIIRDRDERPVGLRWLIRDVSARKEAEQKVRRERDFAETLIQQARAAVVTTDLEGYIVRCNAFTTEMMGYLVEEMRGHLWSSVLVCEDDRLPAAQWFRQVAAEGSAPPAVRRVYDRSENARLLEWSGTLLPGDSEAAGGVLLVGHDITQLEAAQRRALQAERLAAIGQMVTGLAHESRNALQRGHACLEMLALEVKGQPRALELIRRLQDAQEHLQQLYEEVRQFAVPVQLKRQPGDLREVWRRAWDNLESARSGRAVTLKEFTDGWEPRCPVDSFRLEQVFRNILDNALAACSDPVEIAITCLPAELRGRRAVQVSFCDNGPGLSPEQRRRVFEPFYTTKVRGTGLGLAIARRIIEAHEGVVAVGNTQGRGAEFLVTLPQEEHHETSLPDRSGG